jgi:hypothetical protein
MKSLWGKPTIKRSRDFRNKNYLYSRSKIAKFKDW